MTQEREIPDATVARLPIYQRALVELASSGDETVSSAVLADLAGVNAAKVRKDLSHLGTYGVRGVGYDVKNLLMQIGQVLGLDVDVNVVIVGMGNLGQALARYGGFSTRGFRVVGLIDTDPDKIGLEFDGLAVRHMDDLPEIARELGVAVGVITTPADAAQGVADALVAAGAGSILNFASAIVSVPDEIPLRKVDLAVELQILGYYQATTRRDSRLA